MGDGLESGIKLYSAIDTMNAVQFYETETVDFKA